MSDFAVHIENLGKRYRIGTPRAGYSTLRDTLARLVTAPLRRSRRMTSPSPRNGDDVIWALRNVTLEVRRGAVVGIIGRNGAGKSTLLKILSRITEPTEGRAEIQGRVGSLLEVGTGFHPELTGRENIFLNGAILGMRRADIARRFDEIVAFAEVERFVDTPVKHYSSGMYVRLAFGVAAHLDPEILVVDEVLAVGDAQFQKKCLTKMGDVARGGRTVLFVSHNMAAVQLLCTSAVLLRDGQVAGIGDPQTMTATYLGSAQRAGFVAMNRTGRPQLLSAELRAADGTPLAKAVSTDPTVVHLHYVLPEKAPGTRVGIGILSPDGVPLFTSNAGDAALDVPSDAGEYVARVVVPANTLLAGEFHLAVCLWNDREIFDLQEPALSFAVDAGPSPLYLRGQSRKGFVNVPCHWSISSGGGEA
jgi:lipopolysaccharide transport system ATP-binding protein